MKKSITYLFILFTVVVFSQKKILEFEIDLKTTSSDIKDVIPIVNSKNNDLIFFITDAKKVYGFKLNEKFEVINKVVSEEKRRKFKNHNSHIK